MLAATLISISIIAIAKGMSWLIAREKPRPGLIQFDNQAAAERSIQRGE